MINLLADRWSELGLERFGPASRFSWLLVSAPALAHGSARHVIVLLVDRDAAQPVLVAKLARQPGDNLHLDREIAALRAAQAVRPSGFDSIPRAVAAADVAGRTLLVETALNGPQMTPALLRRRFDPCATMVTDWVIDLHRATADARGPDVVELIEGPLEAVRPILVHTAEDEFLVRRMLDTVAPLRGARLPATFEHGDLYYPNILLRDGSIAVLDWETADPRGFPAGDLFFFLGCAAFARAGVADDHPGVEPFDAAFFPLAPWLRPFVRRYVEALGLDRDWLTPLFVACWTRFVLMKATRMLGPWANDLDRLRETGGVEHLANNLHSLRDYLLWRHSVRNVGRLEWSF